MRCLPSMSLILGAVAMILMFGCDPDTGDLPDASVDAAADTSVDATVDMSVDATVGRCADVVCEAPGPCQGTGVCEPTTGECVYTASDDGPFDGSAATACGLGVCVAEGQTVCRAGEVVDDCQAGVPARDDATCDGLDDDCDGEVDEDFVAGPSTCGVGRCEGNTGTQTCLRGVLTDTCNPLAGAAAADSACDGVDNDCDGEVDEDFVETVTEPCGVGACAENVGRRVCRDGAAVQWACDPMAGAARLDLLCNGVDEDCDGEVDEDYLRRRTVCGQGACRRDGVRVCERGVARDTCLPARPPARDDSTCDGIDTDCDGLVDEDVAAEEVFCGVGACQGNAGERRCVRGAMVSTCDPLHGAAEDDSTCDGLDNDCDGEVDEDFSPRPIRCGEGLCVRDGVTGCQEGEEGRICTPGAPPPGFDETYQDRRDNDCDGRVDEDYNEETGCIIPDEAQCDTYAAVRARAGDELDFIAFVTELGLPEGSRTEMCEAAWMMTCPIPECPEPDLNFCLDPGPAPQFNASALLCWRMNVWWKCPILMASNCPAVDRLSQCDSPVFYEQQAPQYDPSCANYVHRECDDLLFEGCGRPIDLETCATLLPQLGNLPFEICEDYVATQCERRIRTECPYGSSRICADIAAGQIPVHPLCEDVVAERCPEDYADLYCPGEIFYPVDAERCFYERALLDREENSEVCAAWVEARCDEEMVSSMEAHEAAGVVPPEGGEPVMPCESRVVVTQDPAGYEYEVRASISDPSRFDCPRWAEGEAKAWVPPHFREVELTDDEANLLPWLRLRLDLDAGHRIRSCEGYVMQKYWNYELFQVMAEIVDEDSRRLFQLAYGDNHDYMDYAIGFLATTFGVLEDMDGFGVSHQPPLNPSAGEGGMAEKNDYMQIFRAKNSALFRQLRLDRALRLGVGDPDEAAAINAAQAAWLDELAPLQDYWPRGNAMGEGDGWHWHAEMSFLTALAGITDEELYHQHAQRKQFELLLSEYRELSLWWESVPLASRRADPNRAQSVAARLDTIVVEVEALLMAAQARGCFEDERFEDGTKVPSVCDWAPQDFSRDVALSFLPYRTVDLRICRQHTVPLFGPTLIDGYTYFELQPDGSVAIVSTPSNPTRTVREFEIYLARQRDSDRLASLYFRGLGDRERPVWGESYGDADEWGDPSLFAAGYDYGAGWQVIPPDLSANLCNLAAGAEAHLEVYLHVLDADARRSLIDAGFNANTQTIPPAQNPAFEVHLNVLGVEQWQMGGTLDADAYIDESYEYNVVYEPERYELGDDGEGVGAEYSAPVFSIAGFNIMLTAGYAAHLGLDVSGQMRGVAAVAPDGACQASLDLALGVQVVPFAEVDGFLELGIDFFVAELGIGGTLRLIDARLPVNLMAGAAVQGSADATTAEFFVDAAAKLVINALSGRLYVYIDPIIGRTRDKTFFKFGGIDPIELKLLDKHYSHNLGQVFEYCDETDGC